LSRARENWLFALPLVVLWLLAARQPHYPGGLAWADQVVDLVGLGLILVGFLVRVAARGWKSEALARQEGLVRTGLYGYVRHPMYVGTFLAGVGLSLNVAPPWFAGVFAVWFVLVHSLVARREERALREQFGEAYAAYAQTVPACVPRWRQLFSRQPIRPQHPRRAARKEGPIFFLALLLLCSHEAWELQTFHAGHGWSPGAIGLWACALAGLVGLAVLKGWAGQKRKE